MTITFRHGAVITEIGIDVMLHSLLSTVAVPPTAANTCPVAQLDPPDASSTYTPASSAGHLQRGP